MGMFDYIVCRKPLPGTPPDFCKAPGHQFQTKDLECLMDTYEILEDGHLARSRSVWGVIAEAIGTVGKELPIETVEYHGDIHFYDSNLRACGPQGTATHDGEDCESVNYRARFVNGVCTEIVETARVREPAMSMEKFNELSRKRDAAIEAALPPNPTVRVGTKLYRHGEYVENGYVEVVAEGILNTRWRMWAVRHPDGHLELAHEYDLNSSLFATKADAERVVAMRKEQWSKSSE